MTSDTSPMRHISDAIAVALDGGPPIGVATVTDGGSTELIPGAKLLVRTSGEREGAIAARLDETIARVAHEQLTTMPRVTVQTLWVDRSGEIATRRSQAGEDPATIMVELFEAPARLVVIGGGHVGLAVATLGEFAGFSVAVFDDREDFANRERFPMAEHVFAGDLRAGLEGFDFGATDYVVLVSRGHQLDQEGLRSVVDRGCAYVGMIGSRRRTQAVLTHLLDEGFAAEALDAVRTPIGLDIGAETPEEIAVSIMAEIIMARRGGSGGHMVSRRASVTTN